MATSEKVQDLRNLNADAFAVMNVVTQDEAFMAGVFKALEEESAGEPGMTLQEIREAHGLTH